MLQTTTPVAVPAPSAALSPSEVVLLRPADFVPGFRLEKVDIKHYHWFNAVWIAATGAVVAAGQLRLTVEPRKQLFGLLTRPVVRAEGGSERGDWPDGSLESAITARLDGRAEDLEKLYAAVLGGPSRYLTGVGMFVARSGLLRRGLLKQPDVKQKNLVGWTSTSTTLVAPPSTEALAASADVAAVRRLVDAGGGAAPDAWALVAKTFKRAVEACTIPEPSYDRS